jgi:disulfide bond formation protein DsbB
MHNLSPARFGQIIALLAFTVLATVLISQYGFDLYPCTLCLWQRWPYGLLLIAGLLLARRPRQAGFWLAIITVLWMASAALGMFHVGVEQHWWPFGGGCTAQIYEANLSSADLLARIKQAPVVRCDEPAKFLFGISMAIYNALLSVGMVILSVLFTARVLKRKTRIY